MRRLHFGHRRVADQVLLPAPAEEGLAASIAVVGGRRFELRQQVDDECLDVLAADVPHVARHPVRREEPIELDDGLAVGLDGPLGLALRPQRAHECPQVDVDAVGRKDGRRSGL